MGCNGQVAGKKRSRWAISDGSGPFHTKEACAIYWALIAVKDTLKIHREFTDVDNTTLVRVLENQWRKDISFNRIVKDLYRVTYINNIDLKIDYIPSKCYSADAPSRKHSSTACLLKSMWYVLLPLSWLMSWLIFS